MKEEILEFEAVARIDDTYAIGSCTLFNGLFEINMKTCECKYMQMFPDEDAMKRRMHTKAFLHGNNVIFVPCSADHIAIYNIEKEQIINVSIRDADTEKYSWYLKSNKFNDGVLWKNNFFLIGSTYPAIVRMNLKTYELTYYDKWVSEEFAFRKSPAVIGNIFYVPSIKNNAVLSFDMDLCRGEIHHVGDKNNGCWGICCMDGDLWMSPQEPGPVVRWNPLSNEVYEYSSWPEGFDPGHFSFTKIYKTQNGIGLLPAYANMGIILNASTGEMTDSHILEKEKNQITTYLFDDRTITCVRNSTADEKRYFFMDTVDHTMKPIKFIFYRDRKKYLNDYFTSGMPVWENDHVNLADFLEELFK